MSLEDTLRDIVRHELRAALAEQQDARRAELDKLRDELAPKLLNRAALATMLGKSTAALRNDLSRKSKLGKALLRLAVVGLNGKQAWRPSDIAAHCGPWLGTTGAER